MRDFLDMLKSRFGLLLFALWFLFLVWMGSIWYTRLPEFALPVGVRLHEPLPCHRWEGQYGAEDQIGDVEPVRAGRGAKLVLHQCCPPFGHYQAEIWCNPHEPGEIFLRACEYTTGYRLSEQALKRDACRKARYDADANHVFLTKMRVMICEGNYGEEFAVRFELWFRPEKGPERKLMEKVYRVYGRIG